MCSHARAAAAFERVEGCVAGRSRMTNLGEVANPKRPVARHLDKRELARLGAVLEEHKETRPRTVAALRLLMLTGARVSEVLNLRWDEIGTLSEDGSRARLGDSKTGPRTLWLGCEAVRLIASLPKREDEPRVFPADLTSGRLYTFWTGVREKAGLQGARIHDLRHSFASQGAMNGVGLPTVGRLLGHRRRSTTAIYAHFDDATLQDAATLAASVIARAMRFRCID